MMSSLGWMMVVVAVLLVAVILMNSLKKRQVHIAPQQELPDPILTDDPVLGDIDGMSIGTKTPTADTAYEQAQQAAQPADTMAQTPAANTTSHATTASDAAESKGELVVMHVFAPKGQSFAGYELLQALLGVGMRYGEMKIFHRYQDRNGHGPVMFSMASATEPGTFDIQKIGGCECDGLTLFMRRSDSIIDQERFDLMLDTAQQLATQLGGVLLDHTRKPFTQATLDTYQQQLAYS